MTLQNLEARLGIEAADDLDEIGEGSLVQELPPVIGTVGEPMLDPGPALADGVEDRLGVRNDGRVEIDHQEAAVGLDDDMALGADDLRVQNLAQIDLGFAPAARRPRQQRPDILPLSVRQVLG